jgi:hypothetical protein
MLNTYGPHTLREIIHEIRLLNAVYSPETGRFHPDRREHDFFALDLGQTVSFRARHDATVSIGDSSYAVVARNADRAYAAGMLRHLRAGRAPLADATVSIRGRADESYWLGIGAGSADDGLTGDENGLCEITLTASEIALLTDRRIDDFDDDDAETRGRMGR